MRKSTGVGLITALIGPMAALGAPAAAQTADPPRVEVLAEGLDGPRGIAVASDGTVYVVESGVGGDAYCESGENPETGEASEICYGPTASVTMIAPDGTVSEVVDLPSRNLGEEALGASDVSVAADGSLYITVGFGGSEEARDAVTAEWAPAAMFGTVQKWSNGALSTVFDMTAWEADNDPNAGQPSTQGEEGAPSDDSNPNGVLAVDGMVYAADAGGNSVLHIDPNAKTAEMVAFLPDRMVEVPPMFGAPPGTMMPMQAVPTSLTLDPDDNVEIGQLTGFPFPVGGANVYEIDGDTTPATVEEGFTNIMDLGYRDGELFVLEIAHNSLLSGDITGALVRVRPDGSRIALLRDVLMAPGGMAVGPDGMIYISNGGVFPGGGTVLRFDPSQAADAATQSACPPDVVPGADLSDITDTAHEANIVCTAWWGLFAGMADGTFQPGASISRGQFAAVIARLVEAAGGDLSMSPDTFNDDDGTTHEESIDKLAAAGLVSGYADGTYRPNEPVTRAQAASMIVAAYGYVSDGTLDDSGDTFTDDDGTTHEASIQAANDAGWVNGVTATEFAPNGSITRGQVASILARVASTLVDEDLLTLPS